MRRTKILISGFAIKKLALILIFITGCISLSAVNDNDRSYYDSLTYAQYLNEEWTDLIVTGKKALDNDIDFYYLRMRIGIAAYNLNYYFLASDNFSKALQFEPASRPVEQYLYYSFVLSGRSYQATRLYQRISIESQKQIEDKPGIVNRVFAGGGAVFSNNFSKNDNWKIQDGDTLSGYSILTGNKTDVYTGLELNLWGDLSLTTGLNTLKVKKRVDYQYPEYPLKFDSVVVFNWGYQNYYSAEAKSNKVSVPSDIKQNEVYFNLRYQLNNIISVSLISNIVMISTDYQLPVFDTVTEREINYQITGEDPVYFDYDYVEISYRTIDSSFVNYLAGINFEMDYGRFVINAMGTYSDFNLGKQIYVNIGALYYLNKKGIFYGKSQVGILNEQSDAESTDNRIIFTQKLGGKVLKKLWCEGYFILGNLQNATADNGYVIYNQIDKTIFNSGITLSYYLNEKLALNLYYRYIINEGRFVDFTDGQNDINYE